MPLEQPQPSGLRKHSPEFKPTQGDVVKNLMTGGGTTTQTESKPAKKRKRHVYPGRTLRLKPEQVDGLHRVRDGFNALRSRSTAPLTLDELARIAIAYFLKEGENAQAIVKELREEAS